ncbi:MAG TPA: hypothetical protein DEA22_02815 [Blastocatellia bacterium]|nr:hypothetical protein [Blastocatellia bacterium]
MIINLEIFDSQKLSKGKVRVSLDWNSKTWSIEKDERMAWRSITLANSGRFELKDNGVIWLMENYQCIVILWEAPTGEMDLFGPPASGRIFGALDKSIIDAPIEWSVDFTASLYAKPKTQAPLSPFREHLLNRINQLLPAPYLSANYDILTGKLRRDDPGVKGSTGVYTSCGSMPGFVTGEIARYRGYKGHAYETYINKYSLNGTNIVRIKGLRYNCWTESDSSIRPKPGDVYALLNHGATDKKAAGISHVGVIEDSSGDIWKTMDLGQGTGFDGKKVERPYKNDSTELFGETLQGGGYRVLAGWVDIDKYFELG